MPGTATASRSAYPAPVEELMPDARDLAIRLDRLPAVSELRSELRIGYEKANKIREQLAEQARQYEQSAEMDPDLPDPEPEPSELGESPEEAQVTTPAELPGTAARTLRPWPLLLLAAPAFIAIWSGWVGLGELTGFGPVRLLPGIANRFEINTAITLPVGMETYAAYALRVWLTPTLPGRARQFAQWSAIGSLLLGAAGQIAFHLMTAAHIDHAPWWITTLVACIPVGVLGMGAALAHLLRNGQENT
jgi:hypothetical protein